MALVVKKPASSEDIRDAGSVLHWEDPLEEGMATHSSILAWRTPWTEEPGGLQSIGSPRVVHDRAACLTILPQNEGWGLMKLRIQTWLLL